MHSAWPPSLSVQASAAAAPASPAYSIRVSEAATEIRSALFFISASPVVVRRETSCAVRMPDHGSNNHSNFGAVRGRCPVQGLNCVQELDWTLINDRQSHLGGLGDAGERRATIEV